MMILFLVVPIDQDDLKILNVTFVVLQTKLLQLVIVQTTSRGVDDNYGSIFDDKTRSKDEVRFNDGTIQFDSDVTAVYTDFDFKNNPIVGVKTPTGDYLFTNKKFVDDSIAQLADSASLILTH